MSFAVESEFIIPSLPQPTDSVFRCSTHTNVNVVPIDFFIGAVVSPVTTELAAVTRGMDGIGCTFPLLLDSLGLVSCVLMQGAASGGPPTDAHTYGVFNMVYGLGNTG